MTSESQLLHSQDGDNGTMSWDRKAMELMEVEVSGPVPLSPRLSIAPSRSGVSLTFAPLVFLGSPSSSAS